MCQLSFYVSTIKVFIHSFIAFYILLGASVCVCVCVGWGGGRLTLYFISFIINYLAG